jgi:predicted nucleic acid-binding protein
MEVLAGADDAEEEAIIREFLSRFKVQPLEKAVAERAIKIRRQQKLKLPDAIIWATAKELAGFSSRATRRIFRKRTQASACHTKSSYTKSQ